MNRIEIPNELKNLAKLTRGDLVENLGIDAFRSVLLDIFWDVMFVHLQKH